ncbi:MAG: hypothetical protein RBU27_04785 [Bacteroidota bacterium]|nr:hypothetical protein [Bacteroidota bacterium]
MARAGRSSPHLETCAFCREQFELAVDLLAAMATTPEIDANATENLDSGVLPPSYRLAAQTTDAQLPQFRLRRTWYLKNNSVILRVIEDTRRQLLTGFFIAEHAEDLQLRVRFDGIEQDFRPDDHGVFEIGAASIDIEPMKVFLLA